VTPAVSVVMPFRDPGPHLGPALASILAQGERDFELLAIDDGSTDGSRARLARAADRDRRIRLLDNRGRGLVAALNLGLARARAPLVARMDADDVMAPERLAAQRAFLRAHPECDLVACRVRGLADGGPGPGWRRYLAWQNACLTHADLRDEAYWESPLAHPSVMFRRQRVLALGGYRAGDFPEDYELWLRMLSAGCRLAKLPQVLLDWRDHPRRASRCDPRYRREAFDALRATHLAADPRLHQGRPLVVWGAGPRTRRRARRLLAHGLALHAWVDVAPRRIGRWLAGVPVLSPDQALGIRGAFMLGYVTRHGAREAIAARFHAAGLARGRDYLMVG